MPLSQQLLALLVAFIWGTNFVAIEIGLRELPPFLFATLRFVLVVFPLVFFFKRPKIAWKHTIAYGVLIGFGQFGFLFWAIKDNITPGLASLVVQTQVFMTIVLASMLFKERVKALQWFALAIGILGIGVIIAFTDGNTTIIGLAAILFAAASWAAGNIVVKVAKPADIISFMVWSSIFAIPPLFAFSLYFEGWPAIASSVQNASLVAWSVVLWQTIGNTLIGYGLWNYLLKRFDAAAVTPWALMVPVFGMGASALLLGEPLQLWKWAAAILIISGLVLNIYTMRQKL